MIYASAAAVVIALLALIGFKWWLAMKGQVDLFQEWGSTYEETVNDRFRSLREVIDAVEKRFAALFDAHDKRATEFSELFTRVADLERSLERCHKNVRDLAAMEIPMPVDLSKHDAAVKNLAGQLQELAGLHHTLAGNVEAELKRIKAVQSTAVANGRNRLVP